GADIIMSYGRDQDAADKTVQEVEAMGRRAKAIQANSGQVAEIQRLFSEAKSAFNGIDIVVANAGMELIDIPVTDYTEEQFDQVFNLNTKGTFFTLQESAKHINENDRIVLISSSTTVYPHAGFAVYGGSKTAPKFFVEVLSKELGAKGITVNTVIPGATDEAGIFAEMPADSPYKKEIIDATPLNRMGLPGDAADATAFLASAQASFITGQHLTVNGGATI
ncbi:MAG: SDR family oxidoreductase, partial [Cyclobacteriaceae bacterium]|nr:SDR family oxidoreductase [Cyclobacteriaceae bacterium HetDA_MAG_MS6]